MEELNSAGSRVVTVRSADDLAAAEVVDAQAVICADDDDELNLEIALLARQATRTYGLSRGWATACCGRQWRRTTDRARSSTSPTWPRHRW